MRLVTKIVEELVERFIDSRCFYFDIGKRLVDDLRHGFPILPRESGDPFLLDGIAFVAAVKIQALE